MKTPEEEKHPLFDLFGEAPVILTPDQEFLLDEMLHGPIGGEDRPPTLGKSPIQSTMDAIAEQIVGSVGEKKG